MYILTQDQKKIVNTEKVAMIEMVRTTGQVYAVQNIGEHLDEYIILGKYGNPKGALLDIFIALRNGNSSYEMPQSTEGE
ncbi:MAG: hypothetical protein Q4A29_03955 [Eubacteriales bacterium]|nr:hypothetical protein [Eubacteriales bacterium]